MQIEAEENEENEVSLLDLLLVAAANLKLLILGPLLAGLLALGIGYALPQSFTSQAHLDLGELGTTAETMMRSPAVLDVVLAQFPSSQGLTDRSRQELSKKFRLNSGSSRQKTGAVLTKLEVDDESPQRAQALGNALIEAWLATTKPQPDDKLELERKLKLNQEALETVSQLLKRISGESPKLILPNVQFELATPTVQLLQLRNGYVDAIAAIKLQLRGKTHDVISSPPTLPTEPSKPKKALIAVMAALGTGFALLLWVFMHHSWSSAAQDPQTASKQARLRAAIGFKARP